MKKVLSVVFVIALMSMPLFAQSPWTEVTAPNWQYVEVFDSTAGAGAQGIVWDGEGKMWTGSYGSYVQIRNADGTPASFSPIDTVTIADTLYSLRYCRGIDALPDGDIIVASGPLVMKFDHTNGDMLGYYDVGGTTASPAIDNSGYIYVPQTVGVSPVVLLDSDLGYVQDITLDGAPGVARDIAVDASGRTLYVTNNSFTGPLYIYESPDLVNYNLSDSLFANASGDTIFPFNPIYANWGPDSLLWVSNDDYYAATGAAGAVDNSLFAFNFSTEEYFEVMMPDTSIVNKDPSWFDGIWYYNGPRGCVFSDDGMTMYVASPNMGYIYKYEKVTGVSDEINARVPEEYGLYQNYPNPFNPTTVIPFKLIRDGKVTITVYDVRGRQIATVVNKYMTSGVHEVNFDGSNLSTGVYYYRLQTDKLDVTREMILVK